jgi:hypothetical protein
VPSLEKRTRSTLPDCGAQGGGRVGRKGEKVPCS